MENQTFGEFLDVVRRQEGPILDVDGDFWTGVLSAKDIDMEAFAEKLATNTTLVSLNLTKTKHTTAGAKHLAEALKVNTALNSLSICDNKILDGGVSALAEALHVNTTLKSLSLGMVGMSAAGVKDLSFALKFNRTLERLDLGGNYEGLTDAGVKSLAAVLGTNETCLKEVNLGNSNIGPSGFAHLAEGLATNSTLLSLEMSYLRKLGFASGKSLESWAALCAALVRNSTLSSIDMFLTNIGPEAVQLLEAVLPMNDTLRSLTIGDAWPSNAYRSLMSKVRKPRIKVDVAAESVPPAVATWFESWTAAAAAPISAAPAIPKKRKRMTEAERLQAAANGA